MNNLHQYYKDNPKQREKDYQKYLAGKTPKLKLSIQNLRYTRDGIGCEFSWAYIIKHPIKVIKYLRRIYLFNGRYE